MRARPLSDHPGRPQAGAGTSVRALPRLLPRLLPGLLSVSGLILVSACAKVPPASDPQAQADFRQNNDPLEPTNRFFYNVDITVDRYTLKPVAQAYVYVLPRPVRAGVHNVLVNLAQPVTFFNGILEGSPRRAGDSLVRFAVNSTAGLGGIFDVANGLGYKQSDSAGPLTLASWGLPSGPYLFLPVLGPSSVRDGSGRGVDVALSPLTYAPRDYGLLTLNDASYGVGVVDGRAAVLHDLDQVQKTALDPYATIRSAYQQQQVSSLRRLRAENRTTPPDWYPSQPDSNGATAP